MPYPAAQAAAPVCSTAQAPYPTTRSREPAVSPELHNESRRALRPRRLGFHQQAGHREAAAGLVGAETGPVAALDGGGGRGIQAPRSLVVVIMRQIGADDDQRLRPAPQPPQHMGDVLRSRIADQQRHHLRRMASSVCRNGSSTSRACSGACGASVSNDKWQVGNRATAPRDPPARGQAEFRRHRPWERQSRARAT